MNIATPNSKITPKKVPTLKKRSDFLRLRSGNFCRTKNFILQCKVSSESDTQKQSRVGYTITTKVGNAITRNRIKRRLRSAVSEIFPLKSRPENDYVVIAKNLALTSKYDEILADLSHALDRVHMKRAKGPKPR